MNKITMDKKYKTRDGRDVRVLCVDRVHPKFTVVAVMTTLDGDEDYTSFTDTGSLYGDGRDSASDLIEQPEEHTIDVWAVVSKKRDGSGVLVTEVFDTALKAQDFVYYRGFGIKAMKKFTLTLKEGEME